MLQKEQGIEVARRTVAKYREGMNIPSSVIRRRQKKEPGAGLGLPKSPAREKPHAKAKAIV